VRAAKIAAGRGDPVSSRKYLHQEWRENNSKLHHRRLKSQPGKSIIFKGFEIERNEIRPLESL
jgi:hypothetical protein